MASGLWTNTGASDLASACNLPVAACCCRCCCCCDADARRGQGLVRGGVKQEATGETGRPVLTSFPAPSLQVLLPLHPGHAGQLRVHGGGAAPEEPPRRAAPAGAQAGGQRGGGGRECRCRREGRGAAGRWATLEQQRGGCTPRAEKWLAQPGCHPSLSSRTCSRSTCTAAASGASCRATRCCREMWCRLCAAPA